MGRMLIDVPSEFERELESAFPDEDKAEALLRLAQAELARAKSRGEGRRRADLDSIVEDVVRIREQPPYLSDAEIRRLRQDGRP